MLTAALSMMILQSDVLKDLPPLPREFRAAWVATVDNIDWPSKRDLSTEQQKDELKAIIDRARTLHLNALVFQVRPSADALYASKLEPWSEYLTGLQGQAPKPAWDPLAYAVAECHKVGIELHCWFNPYRVLHPSQKGPLATNNLAKTNPGVVKEYGKYLWMDPGEPAVQKRSLDVMIDVVKRYDIDGVHIDDYFYPYPILDDNKKKVDFPDGPSWAKYQASGGRLNRDDWRRKNVDDFIEALYKEIKRQKCHVKFGISPFGIYRPGIPEGIKAGVDQYAELYADAEKWLKKGWCDYYSPQLYWPISQTPQAYPTLLDYWISKNDMKRHIWPGLYTSRVDPNGGAWKAQEIGDQIRMSRERQASAGNVHFSFKALKKNWGLLATGLQRGLYKDDAFVPESAWLGPKKPKKPGVSIADGEVSAAPAEAGMSAAVCLGTRRGDAIEWSAWVMGKEPVKLGSATVVAAVSLSRSGVASDICVQEVK